ncbi:PPE domain-containing protein [Mycobacterium stomatepiae]|nr:PPE domain-containing protein [Mycobacterium stomatepiae]
MDFGLLPPEINSGLMYTGPGSGPMLANAASWEALSAELESAAANYASQITGLAGQWFGPSSMQMAAAAGPYVEWLQASAAQAAQSAAQAYSAAAAYEAAYTMTVPPPLIAANRLQLAALTATNFFGQNTAAIAATEAEYAEMWVQDTTAMHAYATDAEVASTLETFEEPPQTTNENGQLSQADAVGKATADTTSRVQSLAQLAPAPEQQLNANLAANDIVVNPGETYEIPAGDTLTLANGDTITVNGGTLAQAEGAALTVNTGGTFTLNSGTVTMYSGLTVNGGTLAVDHAGAIIVNTGGTFTVHGGTTTINSGTTLIVNAGGTATLDGGTVTVNGGLTVQGGTLNVGSGGLLNFGDGGTTLTIDGGTVTDTGSINANIVNVINGGSLTVDTGGTFTTNNVLTIGTGSGGTVIVDAGGQVLLVDPDSLVLGQGEVVTVFSGGSYTPNGLFGPATIALGAPVPPAPAAGGLPGLGSALASPGLAGTAGIQPQVDPRKVKKFMDTLFPDDTLEGVLWSDNTLEDALSTLVD